MRTLKKVPYTPKFSLHIPRFKDMEQGIVYISREYETSSHLCLCGCGVLTALPYNNIIDGIDYGWKMIENSIGVVSFTPSIGNQKLPCKSHYIMTKNVANFV